MTNLAKKTVLAIALIAIGGSVIAYVRWPDSPVELPDDRTVEADQYRGLAVGTWQDDYQGHRTFTIRADGTATMVVEPEGLNAIFASQLTFEEQWNISEDEFRLKAIGGEPAARVNLILKTMGTESNQKILELTNDRMLLLDPDGKTQYDWRRIK